MSDLDRPVTLNWKVTPFAQAFAETDPLTRIGRVPVTSQGQGARNSKRWPHLHRHSLLLLLDDYWGASALICLRLGLARNELISAVIRALLSAQLMHDAQHQVVFD
jgi:hypothetical protein